MRKLLQANLLALSVIWCAGLMAQPQPVPEVRESLQQVVVGLGVIVEERAETSDVVVIGVLSGSPADAVGFLPGDIVLRVDEHSINGACDLIEALAVAPPGTSIEIVVRRGNQDETMRLTPFGSRRARCLPALGTQDPG
jgi:S1-C subfamily serine protease